MLWKWIINVVCTNCVEDIFVYETTNAMYTKKSVRSKGEKPQPCTHEYTLQQQILANNHFLTDLPLKKQTGFHSISG